MKNYRIHSEWNNGTERQIVIKNTKAAATAVQEFFIAENNDSLTVCLLSVWCDEMESFEGVNSKFDLFNM